jgi:hypothetical protein
MTNNDSAVVTTKASFLATGSRLKAIVAATPLLGAAARSIGNSAIVRAAPLAPVPTGALQNSRRKQSTILSRERASAQLSNLVVGTAHNSPFPNIQVTSGSTWRRVRSLPVANASPAMARKAFISSAICRKIPTASISCSHSTSSTIWSRMRYLKAICVHSLPRPVGSSRFTQATSSNQAMLLMSATACSLNGLRFISLNGGNQDSFPTSILTIPRGLTIPPSPIFISSKGLPPRFFLEMRLTPET